MQGLTDRSWATVWDGREPNPYFGMLALSDRLVVTGESVSMVSEALATGRPVHVLELEGRGRRHEAFLAGLLQDGRVSILRGAALDWDFSGGPAIDATRGAAERVTAMLTSRAE